MKITTTVEVTPQMIADQMVTACEGGSSYWCTKMRLKVGTATEDPWYACSELYEDPSLMISVWDDDGKQHLFGLDDIQKGLQLMAEKYAFHFRDLISENGDAITADVFLQMIALKDIVYG